MEKDLERPGGLVDVTRDFGDRVRRVRTAQGYTQAEVVQRLARFGVDMHPTTYNKLENGGRPTTVHELWALAAVLECDVQQLIPVPPEGDDAELAEARLAVEVAQMRLARQEAVLAEAQGERDAAALALAQAESALNLVGHRYLVQVGRRAKGKA